MTRKLTLAAASGLLVIGAAACGSDDESSSATDTPTASDAPAATEAPAASDAPGTTSSGSGAPAGGDVDAFCQAEIAAEAATQSEDPAAAGPAFEALVAAAPEEVRGPTEAVIAAIQSEAFGTPAFDEPYAEVIQYMKANCGFNEMEVIAADYSFTGVPTDIEAGPVIVTMENTGEELHEAVLWRINDETTESLDEILALPEEELFSKVTPKGGAFGFPGTTGFGTADLDPGRYIAVCQIPEGLTPEVAMAEEPPGASAPEGSMPEGSAPEGGPELGPPHFALGMVQEFTVA